MSTLVRLFGRSRSRSMSTSTAAPAASSTLKPFESIPGPPVVPGMGTLADFGTRIHKLGFNEAISSYYKDFGPMVKFQSAIGPEVWIYHPDQGLEGFRQEGSFPTNAASEAWPFQLFFSKYLGAPSKLGSVGPEWARMRKSMQKDIFSPAVAETYLPLLDEPVRLISSQMPFAKTMEELTPLSATDMFFTIMLGWNPKTILSLKGNQNNNLVDPEDLLFVKNAVTGLSMGVGMLSDPRLSPANPGPTWEIFEKTMTAVNDRCIHYFQKIIKAGPEILKNQETLPYFFRLINRGEISEAEAKSELAGLLFAGVDTTHHVLLWTLFNLSRYPHKQEILRQELLKVLGKDGPLEQKHLKSLPYLNQTLRESHRITTPTPMITFRRLPQDSQIGGYHIPKDTKLTFSFTAIQSDPEYVDQPLEFLPERWAPEAVASRKGTKKEVLDHKLLRNPFGYGQRMCVGARVADMEIKALLARTVRDWRFEWSPAKQDYQVVLGTLLKASPFPKLSFKPV